MPHWGYNLAATVLIIVQVVGFSLNLFVIILMWRDDQVKSLEYFLIKFDKKTKRNLYSQIWNPINIIIFNLTSCDFAVSVLGNPFALASALSHRWRFGETGCQLYGFFMAWLGKKKRIRMFA